MGGAGAFLRGRGLEWWGVAPFVASPPQAECVREGEGEFLWGCELEEGEGCWWWSFEVAFWGMAELLSSTTLLLWVASCLREEC